MQTDGAGMVFPAWPDLFFWGKSEMLREKPFGPPQALQDVAHQLTVRNVMSWVAADRKLKSEILARMGEPSTVPPYEPVFLTSGEMLRKAIRVVVQNNIGSVIVAASRRKTAKLLGVLTKTLIVDKLCNGFDPDRSPVNEVMYASGFTLTADSPMYLVFHNFYERHITHIVLRDGQQTVGILSLRDLLQFLYHCVAAEPVFNYSVTCVLPSMVDAKLHAQDAVFLDDSLHKAAEVMRRYQQSGIPIWDTPERMKVVEVLTEGDIIRWFALEQGDLFKFDARLSKVLHALRAGRGPAAAPLSLMRIKSGGSIRDAMGIMVGTGVRHLLLELDGTIIPHLVTPHAIFETIMTSYPRDILCQPAARHVE